MNYIICPKCLTKNSVYRSICANCGENLMNAKVTVEGQPSTSPATAQPQPVSSRPPTASASYSNSAAVQNRTQNPPSAIRFSNKYSVLKGIAVFCNTIAIMMVILAVIIAFAGFYLFTLQYAYVLAALLFAVIFGVSGYVTYKLIAESIYVMIDIEMNTRQTAAFMKYMIDHD